MKTRSFLGALGALVFSAAAWGQAPEPAALDRAAALAEARAGHWERAEAALEAWATATPPDVEACAVLVLRRLDQKRNKEAVALAERAAEAAPTSAGLQSLLGRAYGARIGELAFLQQGFMAPKLRDAFQRSVDLDPQHVPGLIGLANYYLYSPAIVGGSYERADEYALRVEQLDAYNGAVLRGQIRARQEHWAEAVPFYRAAAAAQPQNAWVRVQLGQALARAGDAAAAKDAFEAALRLQPELSAAREGLAALAGTR